MKATLAPSSTNGVRASSSDGARTFCAPDVPRIERAIEFAESVYLAEEPHATALRMALPDLPLYPLPAGLRHLDPPDVLRGAAITLLHPATEEARFRAEGYAAAFLKGKWPSVKVLELPAPSVGDWLRDAVPTTADLRWRDDMTPRFEPKPSPKLTQGDWLVEHARKHATLFHTPQGDEYARFPLESGAYAVAALRDKAFANWLQRAHLSAHGKPPGKDAISQARDACAALAALDGPCEPVFTRTARHEGKVYVDLGDEAWRVVEIDADGWRVLAESPVAFRRSKGALALPTPTRSGSTSADVAATLARVRSLVHIPDDGHFSMLLAWLVWSFSGTGPYPHLSLVGQQDAGKSTATEYLRSLVDPYAPKLLQPPSSARDLMIAARNRHVLAFDNLSGVPPWLSDALCVLSTGGGYSTRRLHTDDEEELFDLVRPVITNGIDDVATRPDLLSRTLVLRLASIPKEARKGRKALGEEFHAAHGTILGALFSCVAKALRDAPATLTTDHRMVEFAAWGEACQSLFPTSAIRFTDALARNRVDASTDAADADPYIRAIRGLLDERMGGEWSGTAQGLIDVLNPFVADLSPRERLNAMRLGKHLRRSAPVLQDVGIVYTEGRSNGRRVNALRYINE